MAECLPEIDWKFYKFPWVGQSEIKSLKREREQLRREIWTLRDEYDKLENLLRIKGIDPDEFLNSHDNKNENADEENDASECSECSCESCCEEAGCSCENEKSESSDDKKNEGVVSTEASSSSKTVPSTSDTANDEHANASAKRGGKERLNVK